MPNRTLSILGYSAVALFVAYLGLVAATVSFVSQETRLSSAIRDAETDISMLEGDYYDLIGAVNEADPKSYGLVAPSRTMYVAAAARPTLSRAGN